MSEINQKGLEDFIKRKTTEHVVTMYLAIQALKKEKNYSDEYIKKMYKIYAPKYEKVYEVLDPELKEQCEKEIREKIKIGTIDLNDCLEKEYEKARKKEETKTRREGGAR